MKIEHIALDGDTPGQSFALRVISFGQAGPGPSIYMQAGLHAHELPGTVALDRLIPQLVAAEQEGRLMGGITLVPHANPVGLAQALFDTTLGRFDLNSRMNFNRAFPTEAPSGLAGSPVTQRLKATLIGLAAEAQVVLDLHCDEEGPVYLYALESQVPQARDLAHALRATVILTDPVQAADTFDKVVMQRWGEAAADRFAATVELRGMLDVRDELAANDAAGLYRYLVNIGTVQDDLPPFTSPEPLVAHVDLAELIPTPVAGAVFYEVEVGDWVAAGQRVAQVLPEAGAPRHEVLAPADGYVMTRADRRLVRRGNYVLKILRYINPTPTELNTKV